MNWLMPANPDKFRHKDCLLDFGFIDWIQGKGKFKINDIIYLYCGSNIKKIQFKCIVEKLNLNQKQIENNEVYWINKSNCPTDGIYMRLRLVEQILDRNGNLYYQNLLNHGLKGPIQGLINLNNNIKLLRYIETNLSNIEAITDRCRKKIIDENYIFLDDLFLDITQNTENIFEKLTKLNELMDESHIEKVEKLIQQTIRNDTALINKLKEVANFQCQYPDCNKRIKKENGGYYIEVAHIKAVKAGGISKLGNLIVLCPNHHKEFDYGKIVIEQQSVKSIKGELNGSPFEISLF